MKVKLRRKEKKICTKALPLIGLTCTCFTGITKLIKNANISNVHFYVIKIYLINV